MTIIYYSFGFFMKNIYNLDVFFFLWKNSSSFLIKKHALYFLLKRKIEKGKENWK